jgi:hypothetical protein
VQVKTGIATLGCVGPGQAVLGTLCKVPIVWPEYWLGTPLKRSMVVANKSKVAGEVGTLRVKAAEQGALVQGAMLTGKGSAETIVLVAGSSANT